MRLAVYHNLMSGGAKRALFEQVRRLAGKHRVDVFTISSAEHDFCDLRPVVSSYRVFRFESLPLFQSPLGLLNHGVRALDIARLGPVQRAIARMMDRGGYDVAFVYASDQFTNGPILLQSLQLPAVCYCHDPLRKLYDPPIARPYTNLRGIRHRVDRLNFLRKLYQLVLCHQDRASLQSAERVLVNSYFSRETVYRIYGIPADVCYLGIDHQMFSPGHSGRGKYVMTVGSVNPVKGFDFIVESLALVPDSIRPHLIVVGNFAIPEERHYLEALAQKGEVSLEFRVMVTNEELVELYRRARMTLYAPVLEPFGLVPLESLACGTPVVGVSEGGVRETIRNGETGLLTDRHPEQFAAAVEKLLAVPELATELGQRGRRCVQDHWSWDDTVNQLETHLRRTAR